MLAAHWVVSFPRVKRVRLTVDGAALLSALVAPTFTPSFDVARHTQIEQVDLVV